MWPQPRKPPDLDKLARAYVNQAKEMYEKGHYYVAEDGSLEPVVPEPEARPRKPSVVRWPAKRQSPDPSELSAAARLQELKDRHRRELDALIADIQRHQEDDLAS